MIARATLIVVALGLTACATRSLSPREQAVRDCREQVASEMGYRIQPDGTWRKQLGTPEPAAGQVQGAGARITSCLRARGF